MPHRLVCAAIAGLALLGRGLAAPLDRNQAEPAEEMTIRRRIGAPVTPHPAGFQLSDLAASAREYAAARAARRGDGSEDRRAGPGSRGGRQAAESSQPLDIVVIFENAPPTVGVRHAFEDAEAVWESLLPAVSTPGHPGTITISAKFEEMDEGGDENGFNTLGGGRTDKFHKSPRSFTTATEGQMTFDTFDLPTMESDGTLSDVILHEMGHVLGVGGNGWTRNQLKTGFRYVGARGIQAFRKETGQSSAQYIPIDDDGGRGTIGAHWDEQHGDGTGAGGSRGRASENELMTGTIDTPVYMAAFTPLSLEDEGFVSAACVSNDDCNEARGGPSCNPYPGCANQVDCWLPNVCGPKEVECLGDGALCKDPTYWSPNLPNKGPDGLPIFLSASICERYYGSTGLYCKQDRENGKGDRCCLEMCGQCAQHGQH